jgi:hypothetical protein
MVNKRVVRNLIFLFAMALGLLLVPSRKAEAGPLGCPPYHCQLPLHSTGPCCGQSNGYYGYRAGIDGFGACWFQDASCGV